VMCPPMSFTAEQFHRNKDGVIYCILQGWISYHCPELILLYTNHYVVLSLIN
jgi:hypothetical protein